MHYAHICLRIVELRRATDESAPDFFIDKIAELETALDDWHASIARNPFILLVEESIARRIKHHAFCLYYEALLHLVSICSLNQRKFLHSPRQEWEVIRQRSIREVILSCYKISSDDLLQDQ